MATPAQPIDWQTLRTAARAAQQHSYAPYSKFQVGAAALIDDGDFKSFNSLFKVLFIFPSQYLFAIGFLHIFSLRRSLSPA